MDQEDKDLHHLATGYIHTYIHAYIHTYIHTYIETDKQTYLPPIMVHVVTDLPDTVLKHTAGGRVSDHHSSKLILVLLNLNNITNKNYTKPLYVSNLRNKGAILCHGGLHENSESHHKSYSTSKVSQ